MFKKIQPLTTLGTVLLLLSPTLYHNSQFIAAQALSLIAFFLATAEVSKYTSKFQFTVVLISAVWTGVMLDFTDHSLPWLTLAAGVAAFTSIVRISFFSFFSYTGYLWTELLGAFMAIAIYLSGFFLHGYSWQGHAFVAPILIFALSFGINTMYDNFQLLGGARLGYQVKVDQPARDFDLPDQDGNRIKLSDFKNQRTVLLIFVRGDWCPMCHMMLRTYEKRRDEFQAKNVLAMAIGPDPVGVNKAMVEKLGIDFKVLSDEGQKTARVYGVQIKEYKNNFAPKQPDGIPLPASFLVDKDGIVRYVSSPERVGEYLNPGLIFSVLEKTA